MKIYLHTFLFALVLIFIVTSCSEEPELITQAPAQVEERIDIVLESDEREYIFKKSQQSDESIDLVDYNYFGNESKNIDFKVKLGDNKTLIIKLTHKNILNPWERSNTSYSIYPAQDEDDKVKFIRVEMVTSNEGISNYISNFNTEFPNQPNLNAFTIVEYNLEKSEILCRINNIKIVPENGNEAEAITITGTFKGSLTFI